MKVHRHTMSGHVFNEDTTDYEGKGYFACDDAAMYTGLRVFGVVKTFCKCCGASVVLVAADRQSPMHGDAPND